MGIKMTRNGENLQLTAETVGIALGMVAGWVASVLLCGLIINWVLGLIGLGALTYWQIVGLLAIWELVKPTSSK